MTCNKSKFLVYLAFRIISIVTVGLCNLKIEDPLSQSDSIKLYTMFNYKNCTINASSPFYGPIRRVKRSAEVVTLPKQNINISKKG